MQARLRNALRAANAEHPEEAASDPHRLVSGQRPSQPSVWWSSAEERQGRREGLAFYFILLLVLAGVWAQALWTSPAMGSPGRLAAFSALMLAHGYLHWRSPLVAMRPRFSVPYLIVQGALAVALVLLASTPATAFGLFPALIGVTAGTLADKRKAVAAALAYLALGVWTLSRFWAWEGLSLDALMIVLTSLFAVVFALGYRRQVDARAEVQSLLDELGAAHQQLAAHALRIEELTRTAERQRMARELHDTLAQGLAGLILLIEAANDHLRDQRSGRATSILEHALARARQSLAEARQAIEGLREVQPGADDLESIVRSEADRFTRATGVPCRVEVTSSRPIGSGLCEDARRILAEALSNVARHARARSVTVSTSADDGQVVLNVRDDGLGFEPALAEGRAGHYGLVGMRERARLAGATLTVESAPGSGTCVRVRLPAGGVQAGA
jgi:NarL family two-component system sensor histidine kinase YdfH